MCHDPICETCAAPDPGPVLVVVTPPTDFFDEVFDDIFTAGGRIQIETLNATDPLLPEPLDVLALRLSVPLELCTAYSRQPWMYRALTLQVTQEP